MAHTMSIQRVALVIAMLAACQSTEKVLPMNQASNLVMAQFALSRTAVVDRLGTPLRLETAGNIEFLLYDAPWRMSWGTTGTNPIAVADGKVVGMGSSSYPQNRNPLFPPISDAIEAYKSQMPAGG